MRQCYVPYAYGIPHTRMGRPIRVWANIRIWGRTGIIIATTQIVYTLQIISVQLGLPYKTH